MDNIEISMEGRSGKNDERLEKLTILPSISAIYRKTFDVYKKNITRDLLVILTAFFAIFIIALISTILPEGLQAAGGTLFIISVFLGYQIFKLAFARSLAENKGITESYVFALRHLPHYLLSNFYAFLTILGSSPLILPAVHFYHSYFLTAYAVAAEGQKRAAPAIRSREYVSGYWWESFGARITALVSIFMILGVADAIIGKFETVSTIVFSVIIFAFVIPYLLTLEYVLYQELKDKKPDLKGKETRKQAYLAPNIFGILGAIMLLAFTVFVITKAPAMFSVYLSNLAALLTAFVF